jgi:hypothetical protein
MIKLWRIDLLLSGDSVNSNRFWADKHVPVDRQKILNNITVGLKQWKWEVFYVVCAQIL